MTIRELDTQVLLCLNGDGGKIIDFIMWCFSNFGSFVLYALLVLFLLYRKLPRRDFWWTIAAIGLIVLLCDQTATQFKHHIPYLRPTHTPGLEGLIHTVYGYTGGLYGTVSGHAANIFGFATFGMLMVRKRWFIPFSILYALLVTYSRTYLGVHFPLQSLFGIATGLLWGFAVYRLYGWWIGYLHRKQTQNHTNHATDY